MAKNWIYQSLYTPRKQRVSARKYNSSCSKCSKFFFLLFLHVYFKIKFGFRRSKYPWRISFILCQKILFVTNFLFFRISNTTTISQRNPLKKTSNSKTCKEKKNQNARNFQVSTGRSRRAAYPVKSETESEIFSSNDFTVARPWLIYFSSRSRIAV